METSNYINRELSWLEFNGRVLEEAADPTVPLLDRLKFLSIFSNNLDEFFMVRVAGLRQQLAAGAGTTDPSGLSPVEQLRCIRARTIGLQRHQYAILLKEVMPGLREAGVALLDIAELSAEERQEVERHFISQILPVLTPVAVDSSHPFPILSSGTLEIAVRLRRPAPAAGLGRAFVEVPRGLPRFVEVKSRSRSSRGTAYVWLEQVIMSFLDLLFPRCTVLRAFPFRITRDTDLRVDDEGVEDLLEHIQEELRVRRRRAPVRLEVPSGCRSSTLAWLMEQLELGPEELYSFPGPLNLADGFALIEKERQRPGLLEPDWPPLESPLLAGDESMFARIRRAGVVPLFHPYESFDPVVRLLEEAADDPAVLAIKQTLYRVSGNSPVVRALQRAAENGKQVTVILEIRARFDEERNIHWAGSLEESGAHVVYGVVGLKIHCKALLIVRREEDRICRYLHVATGNYNDRTARVYTDIGVLTTDADMCTDVAALFNLMTGYSQPPSWRKVAVAPFNLRQTFLDLIDREARLSSSHNPGHILAKMNSLVDPGIIEHLVAASQAGVKIDLLVRGICCLRPGAAAGGNIRVKSVVDRFLEHSRIYYFANGGNPEYYISSADWMQRNLDRRIELLLPVEDAATRETLGTILRYGFQDRRKGRWLRPDGSYSCCRNRFRTTRSQRRVYELFLERLAAARKEAAPARIQPMRNPDPDLPAPCPAPP